MAPSGGPDRSGHVIVPTNDRHANRHLVASLQREEPWVARRLRDPWPTITALPNEETTMADDFQRASERTPPWSNADDPSADRLAARPDAGELHDAGPGAARAGQDRGPGTTPGASSPAGPDAELLQAGGSGDRLGGWHATDSPADPGLPGHDQPVEGGRAQAEDGDGTTGPLVDRLGR